MAEMKRNIKDSVFTCLFSEPKYARELYLYLHPEDGDVREEEIKCISVVNVLSNGMHNDLGLQVRDRLILLMESQTTFSKNISLRLLFYLTETYKQYVTEHELHLHSSTPVRIPPVELYMVYTGEPKEIPSVLRLSDLCGEGSDVEVTVKVLRGGDSSILGQYVAFCRIADEQRKKYGRTREAIRETIRICQERDVLIPFLNSRRKEVITMIEYIFSQEEIWEMDRKAALREGIEIGEKRGEQRGEKKGEKKGERKMNALHGELMKILVPQGRIGELMAACEDTTKLYALADEFGLVKKYGLES